MTPTSAALRAEVVLCTYNGARYIEEQLASIVRQTLPVVRIAVHDDRSSDDTVARVRAFAAALPARAPRIELHVNPANLGFARNFEQALAAAQEDVVFPCDQDDVWEDRKVERLLGLLQRRGAAMAFSDGWLIGADGQRWAGPTVLQSYGLRPRDIDAFGETATWRLVRRNYVNGAACAVRRSALQQALPIPPGMPHDYWLALACNALGGVVATPECLYRYRQHGGNVIGAGVGRLDWQLLAIWRNPRPPRLKEASYAQAALQRLRALGGPTAIEPVALFERKLAWLQACSGPGSRGARARAVLRGWWRGDYRRFATPHALLRDLAAIVRHAE